MEQVGVKRMEFEEALCLYEKILDSYRSHINQCKLVDRDEAEYEPHVGTTLHNIGIVYLLNQRYDLACESLQKATAARASCLGEHHMDYISSVTQTGLAYYAQNQFVQARQTWRDALTCLSRLPSLASSSNTSAELLSVVLNNIACAEFEIGQVGNAARTFCEALEAYRAITTDIDERQYGSGVARKLANLRSNVGYVWLRMKRGDLAIEAFKASLAEKFSDDDTFIIAMQDRQNNDALNVYAKMLRTQIQTYGWNHTESQKTLTKINLLSGGKKCTYSNDHLHSAAKRLRAVVF